MQILKGRFTSHVASSQLSHDILFSSASSENKQVIVTFSHSRPFSLVFIEQYIRRHNFAVEYTVNMNKRINMNTIYEFFL